MVTKGQFDQIAMDVWDSLKSSVLAEFSSHIQRMEFIIMDEPDADLLNELAPELAEYPEEICGLHAGVPLIDESVQFPALMPTRVYLFRKALIDMAQGDVKTLKTEIATTLLHEIGHHFGLDDDDLDRLGFG